MSEVYKCDFCGTEIDWEGADDQRGTIWSCEDEGCGKMFCVACFNEHHGSGQHLRMTNDDEIIRCPDCYGKHHSK